MSEPGRYADRPDGARTDPEGGVVDRPGLGEPDALQRLWTPYRMAYHRERTGPGTDEATPENDVCPFCRIQHLPDDQALIVHRGATCYVVLNIYPYNPGHLLVVPYRHVADLTDATTEERAELMEMSATAMRTVRAASSPDGFNVGTNQGAISGGSVPGHLHVHVVPRWTGDAGFITVIGQTKPLPALLDPTWTLVRQHWPADRST